MKKLIFAILLGALLALSLTACSTGLTGKTTTTATEAPAPTESATEAPTADATVEPAATEAPAA